MTTNRLEEIKRSWIAPHWTALAVGKVLHELILEVERLQKENNILRFQKPRGNCTFCSGAGMLYTSLKCNLCGGTGSQKTDE